MRHCTLLVISFLFLCTLINAQVAPGAKPIDNCREVRLDSAGTSICAFCNKGYAPAATRLQCNKCAEGCANCVGSVNFCDECWASWILVSNSCVRCPANCAQCTSGSFCTKCNSGFYIKSLGLCSACTANCATCVDDFNCKECTLAYKIKKEGNYDVCKPGAFLTVLIYIVAGIIFCIVAVVVIIYIIRAVQAAAHTAANTDFHVDIEIEGGHGGHGGYGGHQAKREEPMQAVVYDGDRY